MRLSSLDIHAFQAVGYLGLHPDRWVTASEICAQTQLSRAFMVRVLAVLVRGQVILSKKGACGGYRLARPADTVTLRDVVHGLDRPVAPLTCVSSAAPFPARSPAAVNSAGTCTPNCGTRPTASWRATRPLTSHVI